MKTAEMPAAAALGLLSALMVGCTGDPFATVADDPADPVAPSFRIAPPALSGDRLASHENGGDYLVAEHAEVRVTLDGAPLELGEPDADGRTVVQLRRPQGARIELRVDWVENIPLGGDRFLVMPLATFERSVTIDRDTSIDIRPADYTIEPGANGERDADGDGDGNLRERIAGTSPFNGSVCPDSCDPSVALYIKRVARSVTDRLEIDGEYDDEWNSAEFDGRDGRLFIDEMGVSSEAGGGNGGPTRFSGSDATPFQFLAMHDGERLYVAVLGDGDDSRNTPWGDSVDPAEDDAVVLHVDTDDPSDGIPTSRLVVPLMGLNTGESDGSDRPTARAQRIDVGNGVPYLPPDLDYATCVCRGARQFWELSVPLASLGIVRGQPFGLEVAMHDDSVGGDSVTPWGWSSGPGADGRVEPALVVVR